MEIKETKKKRRASKNYIHGRKPFITSMLRTSENDLHEPRGEDYVYNKGTICLVSRLIGDKGMIFRAWAHKRTPLNLHAVAGTQDWWRRFFHCWVADSVWLERAESLITKR